LIDGEVSRFNSNKFPRHSLSRLDIPAVIEEYRDQLSQNSLSSLVRIKVVSRPKRPIEQCHYGHSLSSSSLIVDSSQPVQPTPYKKNLKPIEH